MSICLRQIPPDEWALFRAIRLEALRLAPLAFGSIHDDELARPEAYFRTSLDRRLVVAAFDNHEPVGMMGLNNEASPKKRHRAILWGVYVREAYRGTSLARDLLAALLAARPPHVRQVELCVVATNPAALRFYEREGFIAYGREPNAIQTESGFDEQILMAKWLG